jgi:hypothetical protein
VTRTKVAAHVRWLLLGMLVASVGLTGCRSDEAASGPRTRPMTPDQVQEVLAQEGPSGGGRFPGGTFTFGSPFDNSDSPFGDSGMAGGRLASASWDIYWHGNEGDRGAWGAGIDVLRTPERAARALDEEAGFWCPGPRRAVRNLGDGGLAEVRASTCHRAGGHGFYATYDAADGPVLADLTVGGPTRRAAVAALRAVWPSIRDAVVRVREARG